MYGVSFKIGPTVLLQEEIDAMRCESDGYFSWVSCEFGCTAWEIWTIGTKVFVRSLRERAWLHVCFRLSRDSQIYGLI